MARLRRRICLTVALPTYYPAVPRFAPDLLAVLDVEDVERDKWIVSAASPDAEVYTPIVPSHGLYESRVLGLEVQVE